MLEPGSSQVPSRTFPPLGEESSGWRIEGASKGYEALCVKARGIYHADGKDKVHSNSRLFRYRSLAIDRIRVFPNLNFFNSTKVTSLSFSIVRISLD